MLATVMEEEKKKGLIRYLPYPVQETPQYPTSSSDERPQFTGILGLWPWPLVNLLLALVERTKGGVSVAPARKGTILEVVRDERGRIIEIFEREV